MRTDIFLVSCGKDYRWAEYCLASISKFARGFGSVIVLVPVEDGPKFSELCLKHNARLRIGREPVGKGHLWQCLQKCRADEHCREADFILHIDSDCIFREEVTPDEYLRDGKPVLLIEEYTRLEKQFPGFPWRPVVERALGRPVHYETMRRHPMVNPRAIYGATRQAVVRAVDLPFDDFVLSCKPDFPQGFCEFNTIGAVALEPPWNMQYEFIDVGRVPYPRHKVIQLWSHGPLDQTQNIWLDGKQVDVIPIELIRKTLGIENENHT